MRSIDGIDVRALPRIHPVVVDLVIATGVVAVALVSEVADVADAGATVDAVDLLTCAVAFVLIVLRRRAPLPVWGVALVAGVVTMIPHDDHAVVLAAVFLALYTVASTSARKTAWTVGAVTAAVLFVAATVTASGRGFDAENLDVVAWSAVAVAVGDAVRSRRAYVVAIEERAAALQERAERAEQALEEESRRQVAEERLRIARELHDVLAHHIAVINVQAGVADHLLRDDPEGAEAALAQVRLGARNVLDELGAILIVMRRTVDPTDSTNPLPTLDQLDRLVADFAAIGLDIEWHATGVGRPLAPAVGLAAYRIIQESLTNAHRHATGTHVCLRVDYRPDALHIEIINDAADVPSAATHRGHGIIGMRERAQAVGGTIDIGPAPGGHFRVDASLPLASDDR